ncbi:helicase protein MOM1-like protein isoform X1 [Tanacetum coccineum]
MTVKIVVSDSDPMGIPAANDLTPNIEYADGSHAIEDPNGTRPNHVAPNVRSVVLGIPAGNCNQEKAQDTTPSVHRFRKFTMILIYFNNLQRIGFKIKKGKLIRSFQKSHHSILTMNHLQSCLLILCFQVLAQTTAAQTQIQRNANFNQVASQMPHRVDPLHIELEQLSSVKEKMIKSYHDCIQKINIDCEKEIAEAIAEIRLKYHNKRQEADATFNSRKKEVESNMYTVVINQVLAATFRQKCQDVSRGCVALQQGCVREMSQSLSSNVSDNSPEQEATTGHSIPTRLDSSTSQATQLPELGLTLTPTTGRELSHEIINHSVPTLISKAPGPSRKRSRSPSSPFFPDATTVSHGKPASETSGLNPEDVTARLKDIEVEINTLRADTEDKELLISEFTLFSSPHERNKISLLY